MELYENYFCCMELYDKLRFMEVNPGNCYKKMDGIKEKLINGIRTEEISAELQIKYSKNKTTCKQGRIYDFLEGGRFSKNFL